MRKILSLILIAMLLLGLLCGCRTAEPTATSDGAQASVEGVSPIRSGELRQSLFQAGRENEFSLRFLAALLRRIHDASGHGDRKALRLFRGAGDRAGRY